MAVPTTLLTPGSTRATAPEPEPTRAARGRGLASTAAAAVALAVGLGYAVPHVAKGDVGWVTVVFAALALTATVALGRAARRCWRRRATPVAGRVARVAAGAVAVAVVVSVVAPAVAVTHVPRTRIGATPEDVGLDAATVSIATSDGPILAAWYVPPTGARPGPAVVLAHGAGSTRSAVVEHAAVVAGHGYGALMVDARGHGGSSGRAMDLGWYGDDDLSAAVGFLAGRPEVDPDRIALVGLSMGGEEAIGAAGVDERVAAVVAEGATARTAADKDWYSDHYGWRGGLQEVVERAQTRLVDLLSDAAPPASLRDSVTAAAPRPVLLIAAGEVGDEVLATERLRDASPATVETWTVPGAGHTAGLATDPAGWEARVVGFLDEQLDVTRPPSRR